MNHNSNLIQQAGEAVKAGDRRRAQALLLQAVRQDARDYRAWLGLSRIAASPATSLEYARRADRLQPGDPLTQKVLAWAAKRASSTAPPVAQPVDPVPTETAETTPEPAGRQTAVIWAGIVFLLVILVGIGGLAAWNRWARQKATTTAAIAVAEPGADNAVQARALPQTEIKAAAAVAIAATPTPTQLAIQPKHIEAGKEGEPRPTWTLTPTPTHTPVPSPTPIPTFVSSNNQQPVGRPFGVGANERWIDVNLSAQSLTAYEGNTAVFNALISSGLASYPTVTGQFRIWLRYESQTMDGTRLGYDYYLTGVPYVMYFYEDYALHGTYWHSNFGTPMSHGCVNMETGDAGWLYSWSTIGTVVNVHY